MRLGAQAAGNKVTDVRLLSAHFNCSYPISHLTLSQKALDKAQQTALRLNEEGMLSMQHVIPAGEEGVSNWVEFLFLPKA